MFSFMLSPPLYSCIKDSRFQTGFHLLLSKHLLQMPHTWGGSDADPAPAAPPFLLPVLGPGVGPTVFVGVADAVAVAIAAAIDVAFAMVVATPFSVFL